MMTHSLIPEGLTTMRVMPHLYHGNAQDEHYPPRSRRARHARRSAETMLCSRRWQDWHNALRFPSESSPPR